MFCKGKCEEGNILVETNGDSAQSGRYSIDYKEGTYPVSETTLYVSITKLTKSDAGTYQCGLDRSGSVLDAYTDFEIRVKDAPTSSKPEVTPRPFPTSASTLTPTQSLSSVPSSASPERTTQPQQGQTASDGPDVVLYVGLILLAMFIVLSVALLIFCRKRARKEPPMETEYVSDTETNRLYEEIREVDRGSSSPPAETSTIYSYAKPKQPNGVESTDEYSLVNAATAQKETKDDPGNINYSEVDYSNSGAASLHSAPCGYTDNALYSTPRVAQSSDVSHAEDASPSLYSTVS
ncbi:CMRF35-like molecule 8 [Gymnodraco acuticeps]|uniref:CMRF35-like molecule 8 n=1 Tax=Gymnodraco acuticeps TaxID=8218 RepID=A0A6P8WFJ8_GYMAC|nr:CMRF35-like molecule 8 [Gymnodraco acuticeps]